MSNWEKGARIEGEHLESLRDDSVVWIEWSDGLSGPILLEDFREQGSTGGEVYNLSVFPASLDAHLAQENDKRRWDSIFD